MADEQRSVIFILTYLFGWISGVIVYFVKGKSDLRVKAHSIQAIILGLISAIFTVLGIGIISLIIWLYGMYLGIKAYYGPDSKIPYISDYAWASSSSEERVTKQAIRPAIKSNKKVKETQDSNNDAMKALKLRYASGKLTKKQYTEMKKDLEE